MVNDISIITSILAIFLLVGTALPFVNESFGISPEETACFKISVLEEDLGNTTKSVEKKGIFDTVGTRRIGSVGIFDVMASVVKMFFWTCGSLPLFIDLFFLLMRIVLVIIIARNLWIGGGG